MGKLYQQVGRHLSGIFDGKGGAVVPCLGQGFGIIAARDYGVILGRGYQNYIV